MVGDDRRERVRSPRTVVVLDHVIEVTGLVQLAPRDRQTIVDDAPAIWFAEPFRIMAIHKRIRTTGMRADAWWANIADWAMMPGARSSM